MTNTELIKAISGLTVYERRIIELLLTRITQGQKAYGAWNVNDGRDYSKEALEEALDGMMYAAAGLVKSQSKRP